MTTGPTRPERYLVLLPAPEEEWATLPPEEWEKGYAGHRRFNEGLAARHTILSTSPLRPSREAISMRPDGSGGVSVTDGPFTESVEQVVGYYLVETTDRDDFLRLCRELATNGDLLEIRRLEGKD